MVEAMLALKWGAHPPPAQVRRQIFKTGAYRLSEGASNITYASILLGRVLTGGLR